MSHIQIPRLLQRWSYFLKKPSEDIVNFDTIRLSYILIGFPNRVVFFNIGDVLFYWLITSLEKFKLFFFRKVFINHLHNNFNSLLLLWLFLLVYL